MGSDVLGSVYTRLWGAGGLGFRSAWIRAENRDERAGTYLLVVCVLVLRLERVLDDGRPGKRSTFDKLVERLGFQELASGGATTGLASFSNPGR